MQPLGSTTVSDSIELPISVSALLYRTPGTADADYAASVVFSQLLNSARGELADLASSGKVVAAVNLSTALPEVGTAFVLGIPAANDPPRATAGLLAGVLDSYRSKGVPLDLFAATKLRLLNDRAYEQASISGLAFDWARTIGQRQGTPARVFDAVAGVTDADVNRVLRTYYTPEHQITALLSPKAFSAMPSVDRKVGGENVRYVPVKQEPLPAWAASELSVPLKVPEIRSGDVTMHLKNGLTAVIRTVAVSPTIVVKGDIQSDSQLYEPRGLEGVATLTSQLMAWGTTTYYRKEYQTQLDAIAANVSLGSEFSLDTGASDFDRAMQLLADGMLNPAFPQAGFNVLKAQAIALTSAGDKLPATQASSAETNALYPPGDPRRRRTTAKSLQAVGLNNVRRWYAFAYRPDLTTIAIVGNVSPGEAQAAVSKYFGGWKAFGKKPDFRYPAIAQRKTQGETITVKSPSAVQSEVTLKQVVDLDRGDADYVPLLLANTILSGEGTGSLLFREMRTRDGYVYSVASDLNVGRYGSTFTITYASDPKNVDRAQSAAVAIIKRMQKIPLDEVELQRAKALLIAERVLPLDSYGGIASHLLDVQSAGSTVRQSDFFWKTLRDATPRQVQIAVRRYLRPEHFLRIIVEPSS